jgi:hypothetical protein
MRECLNALLNKDHFFDLSDARLREAVKKVLF